MKNMIFRTGLSLGVLLGMWLALLAPATPAHADDQVDAAAKQLMAAAGFAERGLHDLAQEEYADFLARHPNHPQANIARYGLALSHYKQEHYDQVVALMPTVLGNRKFENRADGLAVLGTP